MITTIDPAARRRAVANVYYELTEESHGPRLSHAELWTVCYLAIVEATTGMRRPGHEVVADHLVADVLKAYAQEGYIVTTKASAGLYPAYDHAGLIETVRGLRSS